MLCSYVKLISTVIDIDAVGTFTMCHEALKYLKKGALGKDLSSGGTIINISATLHYAATCYQIHVSAAKVCSASIFFPLDKKNIFLLWNLKEDDKSLK